LAGKTVLLVSEPIGPGGIAIYTGSIMEGLTKAGLGHPLLTPVTPMPGVLPDGELPNVQVAGGLFWSYVRPFVFRRLANWAHQQEAALIHGLSAAPSPICARLAHALDIPYVVTVHHYQKRGGLHLDKRCGGCIAVSESLRENLVNDARIPKELVRLIPAGARVPAARRQFRESAAPGGAESVPLVCSIGKLIPRKDFSTFLRAARLIVDQLGPNCSFVIAGDGPEESALRRLTRTLLIDKQVTFCHGSVAHDALLRDTDVYVQCSNAEGFGTMVLQAMAHAVPVVATSTGGLIPLVRDGETGFLVPVSDHAALAARVLNLLNNAELRQRLGEAALQTALADFNPENMMAQTLKLYAEVLAAPQTHA
jgi:glycosyltransferase involved in cell wall biosynthesis